MSSQKLNGQDFFINGNAQVDNQGGIVIEQEFNSDYSLGIVSKQAFAMGINKSVRFVFTASPYRVVTLNNKQADASTKRFAYINNNATAVVLKDIDATYSVEGSIESSEAVSVSNTHAIVKLQDGSLVGMGDNTNGQIDLNDINCIDAAAGEGFTAIIKSDNSVEVIGDNKDGALNVPDEINNSTEQNIPVKIDCGDNFIVVLRKDGTVYAWGDNSNGQTDIPSIADPVVDISCGNNFAIAMTLNGKIYSWGDNSQSQVDDTPSKDGYQYIKAGEETAVAIDSSGKVYSWGKQMATHSEGDVPDSTHAILSVAGDGYIVTSGRDGNIYKSQNIPQAVQDINEAIGNIKTIEINNPIYDNYPILKQSDALNIVFAIQDENIGPEYHLATASDGTTRPIIVGKDDTNSVFEAMQGAVKGVALAKAFGNKDVCFELSGNSYDPFTFSGHKPVAENFVTNNTNEKYEVIIVFSPFGKSIKFRKLSGTFAQEMPYTVLDLNNVPYEQARIAIYIRGAQDFRLEYAEITDEIDAALLPAEALFRDIDTAVLQTRAAQLMVDIVNTLDKISDGLSNTANKLADMGENHKNKIIELENRISALEGN